jgi:molybdenum cofactor synthesis domain-containing protein
MCDINQSESNKGTVYKTITVYEAVGTVLAHDITEIKQGGLKGRAFKKGHIVKKDDVCRLQSLGKEKLFVLNIAEDEIHEDDAAYALAYALRGEGVALQGEPKEGKINLVADRNGLLKINKDALLRFNMEGDVMCATMHSNTLVSKGQIVAGTRAIPLVVKRNAVERAVARTVEANGKGVISVKELRKPRTGVVITGNEVYHGRIKDAFGAIITQKIRSFGGEIIGMYYAPDDASVIEQRLRELVDAGADLLITTGGMSVDPDDVTRFAIRNMGVNEYSYGSAVLPGAMILVSYINKSVRDNGSGIRNIPISNIEHRIPVLGIPACGMYHRTTVFDLVLPRILAGEYIGRNELAELGHGGLCLHCDECRYPLCPFGK